MSSRERATEFGLQSDCPFCIARAYGEFQPAEVVVLLGGSEAGLHGRLTKQKFQGHERLCLQYEPSDESSLRLLDPARDLVLPLAKISVPTWMPPFDLKRLPRLEELAWRYMNESFIGDQFQWSEGRAAWLISAIWHGRIDLEPQELSSLLIAHGLPPIFQDRIERQFIIGQKCLISGAGRQPCKSWRKPHALAKQFTEIVRYSYRWM